MEGTRIPLIQARHLILNKYQVIIITKKTDFNVFINLSQSLRCKPSNR